MLSPTIIPSKPPAKRPPFQTIMQPIKLNNDKIRFIVGIAEYLPSKTYLRGTENRISIG
jgi:5-methylcytosine-specific restriction endonuclease McrBC GTP-binding regulatory subunit McrB